jgi:hypothetical protein
MTGCDKPKFVGEEILLIKYQGGGWQICIVVPPLKVRFACVHLH